MYSLSAHDVLHLWETGRQQHPIDRALTMLAAALPDMTYDNLARLPIGTRDSLLLALREKTFGRVINAFSECPRCSEGLEFSLNTSEVRTSGVSTSDGSDGLIEVTEGGAALRFRLPDSTDLAAAAGLDTGDGRSIILKRCISSAAGDCIHSEEIGTSAEISEAIIRRMASASGSDAVLDLACAACGHRYQTFFDIASFLWLEVSSEAKRLLREVDALARAYGWCETDILSMSSARRKLYLEFLD